MLTNPSGGRLAQPVERLLYTQDVGGSIPSPPTSSDDYCDVCTGAVRSVVLRLLFFVFIRQKDHVIA